MKENGKLFIQNDDDYDEKYNILSDRDYPGKRSKMIVSTNPVVAKRKSWRRKWNNFFSVL